MCEREHMREWVRSIRFVLCYFVWLKSSDCWLPYNFIIITPLSFFRRISFSYWWCVFRKTPGFIVIFILIGWFDTKSYHRIIFYELIKLKVSSIHSSIIPSNRVCCLLLLNSNLNSKCYEISNDTRAIIWD